MKIQLRITKDNGDWFNNADFVVNWLAGKQSFIVPYKNGTWNMRIDHLPSLHYPNKGEGSCGGRVCQLIFNWEVMGAIYSAKSSQALSFDEQHHIVCFEKYGFIFHVITNPSILDLCQ